MSSIGFYMYSLEQSRAWHDSIESQARNAFIKALDDTQKNCAELKEMFIAIFDEHSYSETDFNQAILSTAGLVPSEECHKLCWVAIEFYGHNRSLLALESPIKLMPVEVDAPVEVAVAVEENVPAAAIQWNLEAVNKVMESILCPIDFNFLENAVTLSCGHSFNSKGIEEMFGESGDNGICKRSPCPCCRKEVYQYFANDLISQVATIVKAIHETAPSPSNRVLTGEQITLCEKLQELLLCPASKKPLTRAVAITNYKYKFVNEEFAPGSATVDFLLRTLSEDVQELTNTSSIGASVAQSHA
jgi:hypothetical protein